MAVPKLTPSSKTSVIALPATGTYGDVSSALPFGIYSSNTDFLSGAVDQVAYAYKKLGGDVLDIELKSDNVYAAYEEAVLEYSYIVNVHQSKNVLASVLGNTTGTFDHDGALKSGDGLSGSNIALKYPKFDFEYGRRVADALSTEAGLGGTETIYSASFETTTDVQDYDLQTIISSSAAQTSSYLYSDSNLGNKKIGDKKVTIRNVYYKTPNAVWRFYGYYGGLNVIGNLSNYGQWADDSTWEVIPAWQNKLQASAFEDSIYTRNSHYSYEIMNNKLRIYPVPRGASPSEFWVRFTVKEDAWDDTSDRQTGVNGVNNMNTLPFENVPYENINSIGKQWIRRFALALIKETLGQVRGKFGAIPIPGESITLNASDLLTQAKAEQDALREELKTVLDEMRYSALAEDTAKIIDNTETVLNKVPLSIFVG